MIRASRRRRRSRSRSARTASSSNRARLRGMFGWRAGDGAGARCDPARRGARLTFAAEAIPNALQGSNGRFVVVTRGALADEIVLAIAAAADVPVLSLNARKLGAASRVSPR